LESKKLKPTKAVDTMAFIFIAIAHYQTELGNERKLLILEVFYSLLMLGNKKSPAPHQGR